MTNGRRADFGAALGVSLLAAAVIGALPPPRAASQQPERPPASEEQQAVPASIPPGDAERGRYLAHGVAMCVECHSPRDAQGALVPGREFTGAPMPAAPEWARDWALRAPRNRGLPGYTAELGVRLLVHGGMDREGRQLRPPMPHFRMSVRDAADVVAYLKSLQ